MAEIRSPICSVLGHVDHGKSSILDTIRGSCIVDKEAGGITQAIGASIIPMDIIRQKCGKQISEMKLNITIPGLLFIDTPGHAAFTNLRKRGGNLADIAILVVDINEGFKPQTIEAIDILKTYKTPFIIAANKIDLIKGWRHQNHRPILELINSQEPDTITETEKKIYELVGKLSEYNLNSERYDRVDDFSKQVAIVPVSAKLGAGISELLMVLTGLTQRFLEKCLNCNIQGYAKGTILEVKEEKGLGTTIDVILYDGKLKRNDTIVIGGIKGPVVTKVRALLEPMPLSEMMDKKTRYKNINEVFSATGVKISAPGLKDIVAGMPIVSCSPEGIEVAESLVQQQIEEVLIETDETGIIIKADTLGSVEALIKLFNEKDVRIRKASVGNITKKDISDARSSFAKDPLTSVVIGFNVNIESGLNLENVKIFNSNIIYKLIEDYERWLESETKRIEASQLNFLVRPCKLEIMKGYVFRQSNPAICGCEILAGSIKTGTQLLKDGKTVGTIKAIQHEKENITVAKKGQQVAISIANVTIGRQVNEGDTLYSSIPEEDFKKLKGLKKHLEKEEIEVIKYIAETMRKDNPVWGI